jgi:hypothetical protein
MRIHAGRVVSDQRKQIMTERPKKPKTIEDYFTDWESSAFGFGYGTGEAYILPALKRFFELCLMPGEGGYDYRILEAELTPTVAWLLINALARHQVDAIEYGTSPRYGWPTPRGVALKNFLASKTADELYDLAAGQTEDYVRCYPDACNCGPKGYEAGRVCGNPFWAKA